MATSESMRVFRAACDELVAVLVPHGFTYRRTKRQVLRRGDLFEHHLCFSTSSSINGLPGRVHLEVRAMAWSTALANYRKQAGIKLPINEACLFDTTIENIYRPAPPYVRYDIGDPTTRSEILARIGDILRMEVLRAFDLIESPTALRASLAASQLPRFTPAAARDYFADFGG